MVVIQRLSGGSMLNMVVIQRLCGGSMRGLVASEHILGSVSRHNMNRAVRLILLHRCKMRVRNKLIWRVVMDDGGSDGQNRMCWERGLSDVGIELGRHFPDTDAARDHVGRFVKDCGGRLRGSRVVGGRLRGSRVVERCRCRCSAGFRGLGCGIVWLTP